MLIECPDCNTKVSSLAAACIGCGRPVDTMGGENPRPAPPAPTPVGTQPDEADKVYLNDYGVSVSSRLIDLRGKSYSVRQINSVKADPIPNPKAIGKTIGGVVLMCICCFFLLIALIFLITLTSGNIEPIVGIILLLTVSTFAFAFGNGSYLTFKSIKELPRWGILRFEMSSGNVKALDAELTTVEEVAVAIRLAMEHQA